MLVHGSVVGGRATWREQRRTIDPDDGRARRARAARVRPTEDGRRDPTSLESTSRTRRGSRRGSRHGDHLVGHSYGGVSRCWRRRARTAELASLTVVEPPCDERRARRSRRCAAFARGRRGASGRTARATTPRRSCARFLAAVGSDFDPPSPLPPPLCTRRAGAAGERGPVGGRDPARSARRARPSRRSSSPARIIRRSRRSATSLEAALGAERVVAPRVRPQRPAPPGRSTRALLDVRRTRVEQQLSDGPAARGRRRRRATSTRSIASGPSPRSSRASSCCPGRLGAAAGEAHLELPLDVGLDLPRRAARRSRAAPPSRRGAAGTTPGSPSISSWTTRSGSSRSLSRTVAELDLAHAVGHRPRDERGGRRREQDLAAVPGRADPRRAVDVDPDVALLADDGLAGVDAHPDAQLGPVRPARASRAPAGRRRPRRPRRARGRSSRRTRRPACRAPRPPRAPKRLADDAPVLGERVGVPVAEPLRAGRSTPRCR